MAIDIKDIISKNICFYELNPMRVQDIDSVDDWAVAEFKYRFVNNI